MSPAETDEEARRADIRRRIAAARGTANAGLTTDEIMVMMRGEP